MKLEQRFKPVTWACACLLITAATLNTPVAAVDKGIYDGEWRSQSPDISLKITPQDARFTINGKTYTDSTPEFFYGQLATYPFLYLHADEASSDPAYAQNEHRLYLIMGEDDNHTQSLRGYYDDAKIRADHYGTVESQSYPIDMARVGSAPDIQVPPPKGSVK
jgi:uncharacterized protein with LGFP repeats